MGNPTIQNDNETYFDYITRVGDVALHGEGEEKGVATLILKLSALAELEEMGGRWEESGYDENGYRMKIARCNFPESIIRDLKRNLYGQVSNKSRFSIIDSFGVFGKLSDSYAGFILDFFWRKPTKAVSFVQCGDESLLRKVTREIFGYGEVNGNPAYTETNFGRKSINLQQHEEKENIEAIVLEGDLRFGGTKTQNDVVKELIESSGNNEIFIPKNYVLKTYDFHIDFDLDSDDEAMVQAGAKKFRERIDRVSELKFENYSV